MSVLTWAANSCGELPTISEPSLVSFSRTPGSCSDLTMAALSRATMAGAVRAGAATPNQFSTSNPASPDSASDGTSASDAARGTNGTLRADYNGEDIQLANPTADQFFNTAAFSLPPPGLFGNSSRNVIIGPGSKQLNAQFSRDVRMGGNRTVTLQLNATNLLNMVNYASVDTVVNSPTFGQILSVRPMRTMTFNLRFRF